MKQCLFIHAKAVRRGRPLLRENLAETDQTPSKTQTSKSIFARSASAVAPSISRDQNLQMYYSARYGGGGTIALLDRPLLRLQPSIVRVSGRRR